MIVKARLVTKVIDGIDFMSDDVAVGKEYVVDLSQKQMLAWTNSGVRLRDLECVPDVVNGGWLPTEVLSIGGTHESRRRSGN